MEELHQAIINNDYPKFAQLLSDKNIDSYNEAGNTPLITAILYERIPYAKLLLQSGANFNYGGFDELDFDKLNCETFGTCLHLALTKNQVDLAEIMLAKDADPNQKSKHGFTAFDCILYYCNNPYDTIKRLTQKYLSHLEHFSVSVNIILEPDKFLQLGDEVINKIKFHDNEINNNSARDVVNEIFNENNLSFFQQEKLGTSNNIDEQYIINKAGNIAAAFMTSTLGKLPPEVKFKIAKYVYYDNKKTSLTDTEYREIDKAINLTTYYNIYQEHHNQLASKAQGILDNYNQRHGTNITL